MRREVNVITDQFSGPGSAVILCVYVCIGTFALDSLTVVQSDSSSSSMIKMLIFSQEENVFDYTDAQFERVTDGQYYHDDRTRPQHTKRMKLAGDS